MSNTYFQFKQFRIEQDVCAMKVTTDACILGAWTPIAPDVKRVLDIGAGTGLLSLMLAQRNASIEIDAIELDALAADQARKNIANSNWEDRINVITGDVCDFITTEKYELIISNPPFFNNSLLSSNTSKNLARHTSSLSYRELLNAISLNLKEDGCAAVLLPCPEYLQFTVALAEIGMFGSDLLSIRHTGDDDVKRVVSVFGKTKKSDAVMYNLVIKDGHQCYTDEFTALLAPFYLQL